MAFGLGNAELVAALTRLKSYIDYGIFQPVQIAATVALRGDRSCVADICELYRQRRDSLIQGLERVGWEIPAPRATMFVWARIPERHQSLGSLEFAKLVLQEARVAVSPGIGFGPEGDGHVRFSLVENEHRIRQAVRSIRGMLQEEST